MVVLDGGAEHGGAHTYTGVQSVLDTLGGVLNGPIGVVQVCEVVMVCDCNPWCWYCAGPGVVMRPVPGHVYVCVAVAVVLTGTH